MIHLEITDPATGHVLVPNLSADLSFEMVRENPLFNRRGDYTYDIDISLRDPHNRAIYQHIDRLTANSRPQNRRARLLCDGRVITDGTEVILKKEGEYLKIQVLAGNSEMNFLTADENLRIREMNFGTIPTPTADSASANALNVFPEVQYTFPPIYRNRTEEAFDNGIQGNDFAGEVVYRADIDLWPQPFVLYYVEKFVQLLGYTLTFNQLRNDPRWRSLILVSGYKTLEYAKMLPDWTASEFLTNVETFFNCRFIVTAGKTVQIVKAVTYRSANTPLHIEETDILDNFMRDYEDRTKEYLAPTKNMAYSLPSEAYWKYMCFPDDVRKHCTNMNQSLTEAKAQQNANWIIFNSSISGLSFVQSRSEEGDNTKHFRSIDHFAPHIEDHEMSQTLLKIVPAEIRAVSATFGQQGVSGDWVFHETGLCLCPMPHFYENEEASDFGAAIEEGINDNAGNVMEVAFYLGPQRLRLASDAETKSIGNRVYIPQCMTTPKLIIDGYIEFDTLECRITDGRVYDLALNGATGMYNRDYAEAQTLELDQQHTIRFRCTSVLDPTLLFLIHNRLFVCQQLKYTYRDSHQHPIIEGTFFPYL